MLDEVQWGQDTLVIRAMLTDAINRHWWESVGRQIFHAEFVAVVDDLIRGTPVMSAGHLLASWSNQSVSDLAMQPEVVIPTLQSRCWFYNTLAGAISTPSISNDSADVRSSPPSTYSSRFRQKLVQHRQSRVLAPDHVQLADWALL